MSALLPARRGKLYPLRAPKKSFALRSNPVSLFEQVKTETIRYHTLLQTALTYLKELASVDPDYYLSPPRCVYPRACQVATSLSSSIPFLCICADLSRELQVVRATNAAIDKFVSGQVAADVHRLRVYDREDHGEHQGRTAKADKHSTHFRIHA